jgi:hypothetical protein
MSLLLGISPLSFTADWVWVTSDVQGNTFYVDRDHYSFNKEKKTSDLWYMVKKENKLAKLLDSEITQIQLYTSSKEFVRYSCSQKKAKRLAVINYGISGDVLSTQEGSSTYSTIYPDSVNELLWQIACDTPAKGFDFKYPPAVLDGVFRSDAERDFEKHKAFYAFKRERLPKDYVVWYRVEEISGERTKEDVHENILKPMFEKERKQNLEKVK